MAHTQRHDNFFAGRARHFSALAALVLLLAFGQADTARAQWTQPSTGGHISNTNPGNVGIGTATPTARLDVQGGNVVIGTGIGFRSAASTDTNGSSLSLTIGVPAGTMSGDVMIAAVAVRPGSAVITAPAGWTLVLRQNNPGSVTHSLAVYRRVASSEPASYTWNFDASTGSAGGVMSFSSVDTASPVDVSGGASSGSSTLTADAPSVTTTKPNTVLLTFHSYTSSDRFTPPAGMTEAFDVASLSVPQGPGVSVEGNYAIQSPAGATGTRTATAGSNADATTGITVALAPSPSAGGKLGIGVSPTNPLSVSGNADFSGNVGIGTSSPTHRLDVAGGVNSTSLCIAGDCKTSWAEAGGASQWATSGSSIFYSSGNVGVGTPAPASRLHVSGVPSASANHGTLSLGGGPFDGSAAGYFSGSASGTSLAVNEGGGFAGNLLDLQVGGSRRLSVSGGGNLSIGAGRLNYQSPTTYAAAAADNFMNTGTASGTYYGNSLEVRAGGLTGGWYSHTTQPVALAGNLVLRAGSSNDGGNNGWGNGVYAGGDVQLYSGYAKIGGTLANYATLNQGRISFFTPTAASQIDTSYTERMTIRGGNVGIGTSNPAGRFEVAGGSIFLGDMGNPQWGNMVVRGRVLSASNNIHLSPPGGTTVYINSNYREAGGDAGPVNLEVSGTITGGNISAKYQDVAEWVPSIQKLIAGMVVILDPSRSNHVLASASAYDTSVAGVISAQPGLILGEGGEGKVMVATTGRVRVKVDATKGPVKIGDLLVTSSTPGVAMKSEAVSLGGVNIHRPGTIIGKALEPLAGGVGEILVLLSLQ